LILVDTGPLVALCDARDPYHRRAVEDLKSFTAATFATCDAVTVETCFHLPHEMQRRRLRGLLEKLGVSFVTDTVEPACREEVFDWLLKYAEHQPDWADGCVAVLSGRYPGASVWTYDRDFGTTWRRPDGGAIPLATGADT
jgi:predicted nucleic acid-binding protein